MLSPPSERNEPTTRLHGVLSPFLLSSSLSRISGKQCKSPDLDIVFRHSPEVIVSIWKFSQIQILGPKGWRLGWNGNSLGGCQSTWNTQRENWSLIFTGDAMMNKIDILNLD